MTSATHAGLKQSMSSMRTALRLSIKTFVLMTEGCFCAISDLADRNDIHAVEVFALPIVDLFHSRRICTMGS